MLRFEVAEDGELPLPAIDLDDAEGIVIGSDASARVRLPASAARAEHVRIAAGRWRNLGDGADGVIGDGVELAIGRYRVRVSPSPAGVAPTPPQRTESLARELMRGLLGTDGAPNLEVERGPLVGARRKLAPPDSTLTIGRGDDAIWVIAHDDVSRLHAEVRRTWDGVRVVDLGSKNGVRLDGTLVSDAPLRDGALVELGAVQLRFRDPANAHVPAPASPTAVTVERPAAPPARPPNSAVSPVFFIALALAAIALAGLIWVLAS